MAENSRPGINKLARVMASRMRRENESSPVCEFGKIQNNMSLITDNFPVPLQKGDYMVLGHVSSGRLSPGNRVLVLWVENEAVVVDTVMDS